MLTPLSAGALFENRYRNQVRQSNLQVQLQLNSEPVEPTADVNSFSNGLTKREGIPMPVGVPQSTQQLDHFQLIFDASPVGMALVALDGNWIVVNPTGFVYYASDGGGLSEAPAGYCEAAPEDSFVTWK